MPPERPNSQASLASPNQRRSQRALLVIPVDVAWTKEDGVRVKETAETEVVNAHGALLCLDVRLPLKMEVVLTNRLTQQSTRARVVRKYLPREDGKQRIAFELVEASETFWGVSIPSRTR